MMKIEIKETTVITLAISALLAGLAILTIMLITFKNFSKVLTETRRFETIQLLGNSNEFYDRAIENANAAHSKQGLRHIQKRRVSTKGTK